MNKLIYSMLIAVGITLVINPALARQGADDGVSHVRQSRGADNPAGHIRQSRGADDAPGHVRHGGEHAVGHQ